MGWGSWGGGYNPSPPASDGAISSISYPSHLTVLLNSIIIFFQFLFHAGRSPQRPNGGSAPESWFNDKIDSRCVGKIETETKTENIFETKNKLKLKINFFKNCN
jgi:hypothetical protein